MIELCQACNWLIDYGACGCPGGKPQGPIIPATRCPTCSRYACTCPSGRTGSEAYTAEDGIVRDEPLSQEPKTNGQSETKE